MKQPLPNTGPYETEERALRAVVERLIQGLRPQAVYLFGSRAEGRARRDSDFDLAVVLDESVAPSMSHEDAYAPLLGSGVGCDVVPCSRSEFDEVLRDPTNPWHSAWSKARKLYERA